MAHRNSTRSPALALLGAVLLLSACARPGEHTATEQTPPQRTEKRAAEQDPIEPVNRAVFAFNDLLDRVLIEPAATVYTTCVPDFARTGVRNFMRNLRSPLTAANTLLQGDIKGAGQVVARFALNTTAGIGGLVDVASDQGLPYKPEDFGQTLGKWGVGSGPYIVLPVLGPSSVRDAVGTVTDTTAEPLRIWAFKTGRDRLYYARNGLEALDTRARLAPALKDLRLNSLDHYAAVRSAYLQKRKGEIGNDAAAIPDEYDDE
jgi:phospholipid-binding lipoprotein MlaA